MRGGRQRRHGRCAPGAPHSDAEQRQGHQGNKDGKDKPSTPDERERWKWWPYDRAELGINDQQSASINAIFESTLPKLRETRQGLDRAEEEMAKIIKEHKADLAVVSGQLDRPESARSLHNKTRR